MMGMFLDGFLWTDVFLGFDFRGVYVVLLIAIAIEATRSHYSLHRDILIIFSFLLLSSIPGIINNTSIIIVVVSQLLGSFIFAWFVYLIIDSKRNLESAMRLYQKATSIIAVTVIIDQVVFLVGGLDASQMVFSFVPARSIENYYESGFYRAAGILYEPSQAGIVLAPSLVFALIRKQTPRVLLLLFSIVVTFSTLAYIGALLALIISKKGGIKTFLTVIFVIILFQFLLFLPFISDRLSPLLKFSTLLFYGNNLYATEIQAAGGSVATLIANAMITIEGIRAQPLFGHGLGSFRVYYHELLDKVLIGASELIGFYNKGGGSLLLRMLFELGFVGTIIIFVTYIKRLIKILKLKLDRNSPEIAWVSASTCFFMVSLLRKDAIVSLYFWIFLVGFTVATSKRKAFN